MLRRSERIAAQNQLLNKNSGNSSNPSPSLPKTSAPAKKTLLRKPGGQVQYPSSVHIVGKSVLVNCCDNKRHGSASSSDYEKRISRSSTVSSCDSYNRKDHAPEPSPRKKLPLLLLLLLHILLLCIPLFGAKVINTGDTETYGTCFPRLWCYYHAEAILEPDVSRGNCWAFKGHKGSATIQLPVTIRPTGFSVEHIPKSMSPTGRIDNAPKDFSVYGLDNPNDKLETLLGKFTYDQNGTPVQTFFIQPKDVKTYKIIELRVESNWGNPTHTCIYRFRVHGDLQK
ncbi:SUN domain-containing protein 2-like isoform X2 [Protopterus annectens]|uniref:SUN domain-containing protein 2-like isoform X2 n=1 Tax=Protopterus annectens TaxID=7888 RepID=UPI001CF9BECD|nr:SUN domain-containing protein 2-like isoform X2 [Protopterus annectens]